ncbi:MAG TPA: choice-of-anchor Q domain-containing protein, partial [Chloroflexia bacterium]
MSTHPRQYPRVARNILLVVALLGLVLLATTPPPARATVYNIADGDVAALLTAIQNVHGNSEITVNLAPNGSYTFDQQVGATTLSTIINASLTINGNGATIARSSASGTPEFNFFSIGEGTLTLKDLTLRNGSGTNGGAIESGACNLRLINVTFNGNHAVGNGGALALNSCTVDMTTVTFSDNHATGNGGALALDVNSGTTIRDSSFLNNSAGGDGGGIYNEGQLSVDNGTFRDNTAQNGGAITLDEQVDNTASITNSSFSTNTATNGGALLLRGPNTTAVGNSVLNGNHALYGGGIYGTGIVMSVDRSLIISNTAEFQGGGIYVPGRLTVQYSTVAANIAGTGPPAAGQQGGGIYAAAGAVLACTSCTIRDNQAGDQGGGLYLARLQLDSEMTGYGITASTISGNRAVTEGGGVYLTGTNYRPGPGVPTHVTFEQSTISGNTAATGGGLYVRGGPLGTDEELVRTFLYFTTIAANQATTAGGGFHNGGLLMLTQPTEGTTWQGGNSLIAGNSAPTGPDIDGTVTSGGYNLIGNSSGGSGFVAADLLDVDPHIGPLLYNGGPTLTHALLPGSPAINAGAPGQCSAQDQRGLPRTDGACDIGAYEVGNTSRGTAQVLSGPTTDSAAFLGDSNWFKIPVSDPDSVITVTLNSPGDYDLYLFAPKVDEETGQLRDIGQLNTIGA